MKVFPASIGEQKYPFNYPVNPPLTKESKQCRHAEQCNRAEFKKNFYKYAGMIFNKGIMII